MKYGRVSMETEQFKISGEFIIFLCLKSHRYSEPASVYRHQATKEVIQGEF